MKKLISITDFVLEQSKKSESFKNPLIFINSITNYANFLKQPLELWMFVPCDEDGNVLENPKEKEIELSDGTCWYSTNIKDSEEYQQAKERCLFEGFEIKGDFLLLNNYIFAVTSYFKSYIEDFGCVEKLLYHYLGSDIELTPTAIKKIGL